MASGTSAAARPPSALRACRAALSLPADLLVIRSNPPGSRINAFKGIKVTSPIADKTARTHYSRDGVAALCGSGLTRPVTVKATRAASCRGCKKVLDAESARTLRKRNAQSREVA